MFIDVIRDISSRFPSRLKHYLKHFQVAYKFSPETFTIYPSTTRKRMLLFKRYNFPIYHSACIKFQ